MYRVLPVQNKYLEKKWNKLQHEHHYRRMREVQSCLEDRARGTLHNAGLVNHGAKGHFMRNYKKEALMEARFTEIERDNRILLEKMTQIMNNGHGYRPLTQQNGPSLCKYKRMLLTPI
jgi:E3 ubiquitin-protein ligase TRIP12